MAFKFPFTNYHELNLTWVLDQLKKLFEESAENVSVIENYDGRLTAVETELPTVSETASEASRAAAAAGTLAQTAKATADTAQENAIQAQRAAGTAQNTAERAQEAAEAATQAAQQAQATAQNFDGRITQAENDSSQALEASRSFENRVQSAITTANNAARTATDAQGVAQNANQNAAAALDKIGDLSALETTAKQNLVAAINEVAQSGGSGGDCSDCAPLIINNASGVIASFSDGADNLQIRKIVGTIKPVQAAGIPSPENELPISGFDNVNLFHSGGENKIDVSGAKPWPQSTNTIITIDSATNSVNVRSTTQSTYKACEIMPLPSFIAGHTYVLEADVIVNSGAAMFGARRRDNNSFLGIPAGATIFLDGAIHNGPITDNQQHHIVVSITPSETWAANSLAICGLCSFSTVAYGNVSYNNIKYYDSGAKITITLPQTVYEGTTTLNKDGSADIVSTMGNIESYNGETLPGTWLSSMDVYTEGATPTNGAQVVYEMATPQIFHFENIGKFYTFLGNNNVWIVTGSILECLYPADTKLYIDGKIAELQALVLENNG